MKRWLCLVWVFVLCLTLCGCAERRVDGPIGSYVLIDPGHGGFDGGTTAVDGTNEKQVNLSLSLILRDLLQVSGVSVCMTRQTDCALGESKVADMHSRLSLYQGAELVISVHQNHFPVAKYRGTQVFYSVNHPDSVQLATGMQQRVVSVLQPDNNRQIKPATDGIYLLHHTTVPAVLVECGFLSNPEELKQLKQPEYQQQLAFALLCGYWDYTMEK